MFWTKIGRGRGGAYGRQIDYQSDNDLSHIQSDICIIVALLWMSHWENSVWGTLLSDTDGWWGDGTPVSAARNLSIMASCQAQPTSPYTMQAREKQACPTGHVDRQQDFWHNRYRSNLHYKYFPAGPTMYWGHLRVYNPMFDTFTKRNSVF
jgi:hypothetical protein